MFESRQREIEFVAIQKVYLGVSFPTNDERVTEYLAGMRVAPGTPASEGLRFAFTGGSNMKPEDGHIHGWSIQIADADHVEERWTYWEGGTEQHATAFTMTRRAAE